MSDSINYKAKYEKIRMQFVNSMDQAFRLGYEEGMRDAQMEAMQQQLMAQQQAAMGEEGAVDENGQPIDENGQPVEGEMQQGGGSELDQHISQLESMVNQGGQVDSNDIQKALEGFRSFQKSVKLAEDLKKSDKAVKGIAKALKKPFAIGKQASGNLNDNAKKALTMQEKIVGDIMKSWETEESRASKDIVTILAAEGLSKKE